MTWEQQRITRRHLAHRSRGVTDTILEALQSASIVEEHRTLMGMVVERVRSAKSGLNEAYTSLLIGFEVCDVIYAKKNIIV